MTLFTDPWRTIAAGRPFLADLARGLLEGLTPDELAGALVLLPTRRAIRGLTEAFLAVGEGRALRLPLLRALGDLDEGEPPFEPADLDLPPAITPIRRRAELTRLVFDNAHLLERELDFAGAWRLGAALGEFLDACQMEEVSDPERLQALAPLELAAHWERSRAFLTLAFTAWPQRLQALGLVDANQRRVLLLRALAETWRARPPGHPIIAAGSTGAVPATRDLLKTIAGLGRSVVVLPGLDYNLDDKAWAAVDVRHPQGAMKRLLDDAGVQRAAVRAWPVSALYDMRQRWRGRILNEALRPPDETADWLDQIAAIEAEAATTDTDAFASGLDGLVRLSPADDEEAAAAIALLMRETLETPGKTCALVTPDALLARRVRARLAGWDAAPDVSLGESLARSPLGVLIQTLVGIDAEDPAPAALLALVKHPLAQVDHAALEPLERVGLRGLAPGWTGLEAKLKDHPEAQALARRLHDILADLAAPFAGDKVDLAAAAAALVAAVEALAGPGAWTGPGGEEIARLLAALTEETGALPPLSEAAFQTLIESLLADETWRPQGPAHPRLAILGVLEARLLHADRLILAGLEEGLWPPAAPVDPFLSRPMRAELGLPSPDRRIGLSAHDFAQLAAAREVYLVDRARREGAPAVASRWLWRLETLCKGAGKIVPARNEVLAWARALDAPIAAPPDSLRTAARPAPKPPVHVRPRTMAVTRIEEWIRDPYAAYARHILRLRPLDRPGRPFDARDRGTAIHAALEAFAETHPDDVPDGIEDALANMILTALKDRGQGEADQAREAPRALRAAGWLAEEERKRRQGARLLVEQQGRLAVGPPERPFTVTAKADRLEVRESGVTIVDFKTGAPPSDKEVRTGLAPQLTLTGAIVAGGGFDGVGPLRPAALEYVQVRGGREPGDWKAVKPGDAGTAADLCAEALEGLIERAALFDLEETAYISRLKVKFQNAAGDYDHLARFWEWGVVGEAESEES